MHIVYDTDIFGASGEKKIPTCDFLRAQKFIEDQGENFSHHFIPFKLS